MIVLEAILAFIVLIGILVFIHELGHFLAARWTGMRAEVFAVGMGPRLLGYNRITGFTFGKLPEDLELRDHTDYRISAFPIGGYVKISGMVDESMDTNFASAPPQPWEFRSKNTLQKAFVISAGVIMNFLLAAGVLAALNYFVGKDVLNAVVGPLTQRSPLFAAGLREGDSVTAVNGEPVAHYEELQKRLYIDAAYNDVTLDVIRAGAATRVKIPREILDGDEKVQIDARVRVLLSAVEPRRPAAKAGVEAGDIVLSADGIDIRSRAQMQEYVATHKGKPITFTLARKGQIVNKTVVPGEDGLIGVGLAVEPQRHIKYGPVESVANGFNGAVTMTGDIFKGIGALVTGKAKFSESVAGPAQIAGAAQRAAREGLADYLNLLVIISLGLACMNILPIPALDGGHLVFILVEGITRREVPLKIRMAIQNVGFVLLILLMAFVIVNDGVRMFN
jgi:regulator of sigma E protease